MGEHVLLTVRFLTSLEGIREEGPEDNSRAQVLRHEPRYLGDLGLRTELALARWLLPKAAKETEPKSEVAKVERGQGH